MSAKFDIDKSTGVSLVRSWEDNTDNDIKISQDVIDKMPVLDDTSPQIRIEFDGVNDILSGNFTDELNSSDCLIGFVGGINVNSVGEHIICSFHPNISSNAHRGVQFLLVNGVPTVRYGNGVDAFEELTYTGSDVDLSKDTVWLFSSNSETSNRKFIINQFEADIKTTELSTDLTHLDVGGNDSQNSYTDVDIASIIAYTSGKTNNQISNIYSYLRKRYNIEEIDIEPPVIFDNNLITSNINGNSFDIEFEEATDNVSNQLVYKLYTSSTNNLDTRSNIISNGTLAKQDTNVNKFTLDNLSFNQTIWFNIIVEDESGNQSIYTQRSESTTEQVVAPTVIPTLESYVSNLNYIDVQRSVSSGATYYEYELDGGTPVDVGLTNPIRVNNLTQNQSYAIRLRAGNSSGESDWSQVYTIETDSEVIGAPIVTDVVIDIATNDATVSFDASSVQFANSFDYRFDGGPAININNTNPFVISDISEGEHSVSVRGKNEYGVGDYSVQYLFTYTQTVQGTPSITDISIDQDAERIEVSYNDTNVINATSFEYRINGGNPINVGLNNPFTITAPPEGTNNTIEIRGIKNNDVGDWGVSDSYTIDYTHPTITTSQLSKSVTDSFYSISFNKATDNLSDQTALEYFLVEGTQTEVGNANLIQGLAVIDSNFDVTQFVINHSGEIDTYVNVYVKDELGNISLYTPTQIFNTIEVEGVPIITDVSQNQDGSEVTVTYDATNVSNATKFEYRLDGGDFININNTNPFTFINPPEGVNKTIELRGVNENNNGNISDTVTYTADYTNPIISNSQLSTLVTDTNYSVSFNKATDNVSSQSALEYFLVEGTQSEVNDVNTIESLTIIDSGIDTNQFVINHSGEIDTYVNVYVKDELGNISLYTPAQIFNSTSVLGAPSITDVSRNQNGSELTVTYDATNVSDASSFEYRINSGAPVSIGPSNPFVITNPPEGIDNTIQIRGINDTDNGNWSVSSIYTADYTNPTPSSLQLSKTITNSNYTVSFNKATDNISAQTSLRYTLVKGTQAEVSDINSVENLVVLGDNFDVNSFTISHNGTIDTYVNVYVKDEIGNITLYDPILISNFLINDPILIEQNLNTNGFDVTYTKATGPNSENYIYYLYSGNINQLNDISTIESQTLETQRTNVNNLNYVGFEGQLVEFNILVENPASGQKKIYDANDVLIPEKEISDIKLYDQDPNNTSTQPISSFQNSGSIELSSEEGVIRLHAEVDVIEGTDDTVTFSTSNASKVSINQIDGYSADITYVSSQAGDIITIKAVSDFDPAFETTVDVSLFEDTTVSNTESTSFELQTEEVLDMTIVNNTLSTDNETIQGFDVIFDKAIGSNSENYIYYFYTGSLNQLNDISTIESQVLVNQGVNTNIFTYSDGNQGQSIDFNILVENPASGQKKIYQANTILIPDQEVNGIEIYDQDPNNVSVQPIASFQNNGSLALSSQQEKIRLYARVDTIEGADDTVTFSSSNATKASITLIDDYTVDVVYVSSEAGDIITIKAVSDFDSTFGAIVEIELFEDTPVANTKSTTFKLTP